MAAKVLDGRYKLVKKLGSGGFGHTYIARDMRRPGTPLCVVKHLKPASSDADFIREARRLFSTEADTLEQLGNHDQIPQLLAYFEEDQNFFLVQEYIEGKSLHDELKLVSKEQSESAVSGSSADASEGENSAPSGNSNSSGNSEPKKAKSSHAKLGRKVTETEAIAILKDMMEVLEFVHAEGVIHRDIKPENLIRRKSDRKLVLIDFGAVKAMQEEGTELEVGSSGESRFTVTIGTPGYMPNEQCAGRPAFASDIYAAGMVVIKALTGLEPTDIEADPESGELLWRDKAKITNGLAMVLTRMVRYQYTQRYQSAKETIQALNAFVVEQEKQPPAAIVKASKINSRSTSSGQRATTRRTVAKSNSQSNQGGWLIAVSLIAVIGAAAMSIPILLSADQKEPESAPRTASPVGLPNQPKTSPGNPNVAPPVTTSTNTSDANGNPATDAVTTPTVAVAPGAANVIQVLPIQAGEQSTSTGLLNPGQNLSFTLNAKEGQELNASLAGEAVYMTIVSPDNQVLSVEANNTDNWAGKLPTEGEYQLQLTTSATEAAQFTLTVALGEEPQRRKRTINVEINN
ncbi:serine/threonine protein kinase [Thalassoporum mexicanum PCC 7367]|uniref:protein kinase domain-containing protein n=1 Tax=Thalassoporum mexicanum TaxID=3457544 RepID=UPI00029FABAB|nr:protein kinase [Pseudanabaena sp. PCC 7367]AFY68428.1 serine/threonine protein kinase [Pseudanabaena sp. PCC 7367]